MEETNVMENERKSCAFWRNRDETTIWQVTHSDGTEVTDSTISQLDIFKLSNFLTSLTCVSPSQDSQTIRSWGHL